MNLIVAVDKNWAIGKDNKIMWSIPADMRIWLHITMRTGKFPVKGWNGRSTAQRG